MINHNNTTKNEENNTKNSRSTVSHLRGLMPTRQIRTWEARRVAETQAYRLRILLGDNAPGFDMDQITAMPRIEVSIDSDIAASGTTHWQAGSWRIQINGNEALVRQRFTLAHEFKHVLDAPLLDSTYASIADQIDGEQQIEQICDYFAACLLMPKRWVKRLWGEGITNLDALADAFDVSTIAMKRRLEDIGLVDRPTRSHRAQIKQRSQQKIDPDWFKTAGLPPGSPHYRRALPSASRPLLKEVA